MVGRVDDLPLVGTGTYACNLSGISCTGEGEAIIRGTLESDEGDDDEHDELGPEAKIPTH
ncbi:hypothetical protein RJ639_014848 [Escallonia herrerae]|uniref:Uncharacterized protein n=1 Tax=Escallonia herrerae TaxID=1293975 RepID=A0AA88VHQ7_9ASTE|nr:hypothetical protein RJ639_014848 [Escallonia herrerae]